MPVTGEASAQGVLGQQEDRGGCSKIVVSMLSAALPYAAKSHMAGSTGCAVVATSQQLEV